MKQHLPGRANISWTTSIKSMEFWTQIKKKQNWVSIQKNSTLTYKMPFPSSCKHGTSTRTYRRKNACLIKRRGLSFIQFWSYSHSVKTLLKFKCLSKMLFFIFLNEQKLICKLKSSTWVGASNVFIRVILWIGHGSHMLNEFRILFSIHRCHYI